MSNPAPAKESHWKQEQSAKFSELAQLLAEIGRSFYARGWAMGTSGNFSAVVTEEPLQLAITSTGVDKGLLTTEHIVQINSHGTAVEGSRRPSEEAKLHLAIVNLKGAGAVLHTHSVWATLLSESFSGEGGLGLKGYEMLKGLEGVHTHEQQEWLPIIENSQDMGGLTRSVEAALQQYTHSHAFLLRRHGLYTWGRNLIEAKRHVEILEFLLEVEGRSIYSRRSNSGIVRLSG